MVLAILQARMSSTRLPGKVLKPILGRPMLSLHIERVRRAGQLDTILVATSSELSDNPIAELCTNEGIACHRGSLNDVLDRFYTAAKPYQPNHVVRLTGDCPLADPAIIDQVVVHHLKNGFDYTSNCRPPTFPDGLDVEVFKFSVLEQAWKEAAKQYEREHVTPFMWQQPERFKLGNVTASKDLSRMRWTVDRAEDLAVVTEIYESLYPKNPAFGFSDILNFIKQHPEIEKINDGFMRNEALTKELQASEKTEQI